MPTQIKYRGGTAAEHASFVGAEREITVDTTDNTIRIHDGVTAGGIPLARADLANAAATVSTAITSGSETPGSCSVGGTLFYNTTDGKIYVCDGSNYVANFADATPTSGASTPGSCTFDGELFFNTTDEKLYVCNSGTYEQAVPDVAASNGAETPESCSIAGGLFYNTAEEKLYICNGSTYDLAISDAQTTVGSSTPGSCSIEGQFFFNETEQKLYVCNSGTYTLAVPTSAQIEEASLTIAAFASSIRPVELFGTLPTVGNTAGRLVFLTTDNKLYRYNGSAFVSTIPTSDLTGTIAAGQIAANAVTAGTIAAGAVSATQIAASAITSDKLAAGSILAGSIATNAVTSDKIIANAITSGKISAGAVESASIATNAITSDKIVSGAITTAKISAGAVDASSIAAGSITADKIVSGAITTSKLAASAVTADKLGSSSASILSGRTFGLGQGATALGYSGTVVTLTTDNSAAGVLAAAGSTSYTGPSIVGAVCSTNANSWGGSFVNATSTSYSTLRAYGQIGGATVAGLFHNVTSNKIAEVAPPGYAFYAQSGAYGPFTGSHDALVSKTETIAQGDIVCDTGFAVNKSIVDTITQVTKSTSANQKAAIGVFNEVLQNHKPTALCELVINETTNTYQSVIKSEYSALVAANNFVTIASIGEGMINVCGENGNIDVGDLIVTSNTAGKGMKQSDDVVRNYTVAKARESVTFSSPSEVKQIACIYLAG